MLRLLLVRHAEAVLHAPEGDRERPLTKRGRGDAACLGQYCQAQGLIPSFALVSPALRARETWMAMWAEFSQKPAWEIADELYRADVEGLRERLGSVSAAVESLLMIGHNPVLAEFGRSLVDPRQSEPARLRHFPAPCLAVIDFRTDSWMDADKGGRLNRFIHFADMPAGHLLSS